MSDVYEMGSFEPVTVKKNKKGLKIFGVIMAVILVVIIGFAVAYAVAPRDVMQLFLNDKNYAKITIGQSAGEAKEVTDIVEEVVDEQYKKSFSAGLNVSLSSEMKEKIEKSDPTLSALMTYVNTLKIDGTQTRDGLLTQSDFVISDNNGKIVDASVINDDVLTYYLLNKEINSEDLDTTNTTEGDSEDEMMSTSTGLYFKANSINSGWLTDTKQIIQPGNLSGAVKSAKAVEEQNDNLSKSTKKIMSAFLDVCLNENLKSIESKQELKVEDVTVSGDKITFTVTPKDLINAVNASVKLAKEDTDLYNAYKSMYDKIVKLNPQIVTELNQNKITMDKNGYKNFLDQMAEKINLSLKSADWETNEITLYINKQNDVIGLNIATNYVDKSEKPCSTAFAVDKSKASKKIIMKSQEDQDFLIACIDMKNETTGTTTLKYNIQNEISANFSGNYKITDFEDGMLYGNITQNYDLTKTDENAVTTNNKGKITMNCKKSGKDDVTTLNIEDNGFGNISVNCTASKLKFEKITVPQQDEVLDLSSKSDADAKKIDELTTNAIKYVFSDMVVTHPEIANMVKLAIMSMDSEVDSSTAEQMMVVMAMVASGAISEDSL